MNRFIDFLRFLGCALKTLDASFVLENISKLREIISRFRNEKIEFLLEKVYFIMLIHLYNLEKLYETNLPNQKDFYNKLIKENIANRNMNLEN